MIIFL